MSRVARIVLAGCALALGCAPRTDGGPSGSGGAAVGAGASGATASGTGGRGDAGTPSSGGSAAGASSGGAARGGAPSAGSGGASGGGTQATSGRGGATGEVSSGAAGEAGSGEMPTDGVTPLGTPTIFFLDVSGRVMRADAEARPFEAVTLVPNAGRGPDGIAVDAENGFVYWTNMGVPASNDGYLRRAKLDGSDVVTIVPEGGTWTPKQLRLDAAGGKLYWSDREGMRVQRANVDGSGVETLLTVATGDAAREEARNWCVGIALDTAGGYFYFSQKGPDNGMTGSLRRARLATPDGENDRTRTDVEVLFEGLPEPIDVDLDLENGYLYWTDRGDDTVNRAPIEVPSGSTAASRGDREILVRNVREAIGVSIDPARGFLYYTSATGQLGRADLDGAGAEDLADDLGALTGIAIIDLP